MPSSEMHDQQQHVGGVAGMFFLLIVIPVVGQTADRESMDDLLRRAIVETLTNEVELSEDVVALGITAAPGIREYLTHPTISVRTRALRFLVRIPEVAEESIIDALHCDDIFLRVQALSIAAPFLDRPAVIRAWIDCFVGPSHGAGGHGAAMRAVRTVTVSVRARLAQDLVPRILDTLDTYNATDAAVMIGILGEIAPPADPACLAKLEQLRLVVENPNQKRWNADGFGSRESIARALELLQFAQTSLGDPEALKRYAASVRTGKPRDRARRLRRLVRMNSSSANASLAAELLYDETELETVFAGHSLKRRTCDYAADALRKWFADCPVDSPLVLSSDELEVVRSWAASKFGPNGG